MLSWIFSILIAIILVQSLFFKFTNSAETQYIFGILGQFVGASFLSPFSELVMHYGGYIVGILEMVGVILLLFHDTRNIGSTLICVLMIGALFSHIFTPLGIVGNDGGLLFGMAVLVLVSSLIVAYLEELRVRLVYRKH
ncbi:hypothetical protein HN604_03370 [archaeon]|nr:hypothetical protein [archaeon]MBT6182376.1 hypothetical protein [archaeon]MBT6606541.1 hypothetical protein [archaeon]MBT7251832.1 hypothetical protein [archaeon]MBT7661094.1 hypothetical protein [archaeon]